MIIILALTLIAAICIQYIVILHKISSQVMLKSS